MRIILIGILVSLAGCAAEPAKIKSVAVSEVARLIAPTQSLSTFADYELKSLTLSPAVQRDEGKVAEAARFDQKLRERVLPLLDEWRTNDGQGRTGTLIIEPQLAALRIVSGGARFWAGAFAGDSRIDLDLVLSDKSTGEQVGRPRVTLEADAFAGAWSIGKSDQNLHDYVAGIVYQYLVDNYD